MHINMKYYVVTVGSIFISLGVGILVGFNLNYDQELSKQQTNIINDLDVKFEELKDINDELNLKLEDSTLSYNNIVRFIDSNVDKLLSEELSNHNIGIITTSTNNSASYIENVITSANGNILFNINLTSKVTEKNILANLSEEAGVEIDNTEQLINYILDILKNDNAEDKLKLIENFELIKINTLSYNYKDYSSIVTSGNGETENFDSVDKILIEKLKSEGKHIVGVENTDVENSYLEKYSENGIPTVNNINENTGQLALALVLKDKNIVGNFGVGDSCESLIPYKKIGDV